MKKLDFVKSKQKKEKKKEKKKTFVQTLFGLISEEFLNSFIDINRYTPYTYIYTND